MQNVCSVTKLWNTSVASQQQCYIHKHKCHHIAQAYANPFKLFLDWNDLFRTIFTDIFIFCNCSIQCTNQLLKIICVGIDHWTPFSAGVHIMLGFSLLIRLCVCVCVRTHLTIHLESCCLFGILMCTSEQAILVWLHENCKYFCIPNLRVTLSTLRSLHKSMGVLICFLRQETTACHITNCCWKLS